MKVSGGVNVQMHVFLTSALFGGEWSVSRPGRFNPREGAPVTHWRLGALDDIEKRKILPLSGFELRPLGRPARSQSLYQLSYPGSPIWIYSLF
jgi:hypothetical protein